MMQNILRKLGIQMRRETERFLNRALARGWDPKVQYRLLLQSMREASNPQSRQHGDGGGFTTL